MSKMLVDKHLKKFEIGQRTILQNLREMIIDELPTATVNPEMTAVWPAVFIVCTIGSSLWPSSRL
jgi:hypothetical protein